MGLLDILTSAGYLVPPLPRSRRPPGIHGAHGIFSGSGIPDATFSNLTIQNQIPANGSFAGVRLIFTNQHASAVSITSIKVAAASTNNGTGSTLTWLPVTVGGLSTGINLPAMTGTAPDEVVVPVISDYIALQSLNSLNLLMTRVYFAGNVGGTSAASVPATDLATNVTAHNTGSGNTTRGAEYRSGKVAGVVADNAGINMSTNPSAMIVPDAVIFYYTNLAAYLAAVGGSHLRGNGTSGDSTGFIYRACQALSAANPTQVYSCWNSARGGASSAAAAANLTNIAGVQTPDVMVMLGYSGNDGSPTAASFANARANLARQLETCTAKGIKQVIICTAPPIQSYSTPERALLDDHNAWLRSLASFGHKIMDLNLIYRDPANTGQLLAAYNSGDNIHTNDVGQAVSATAFAALINGI